MKKKNNLLKYVLIVFAFMFCISLDVQAKSTTDRFKEKFIGSYSWIDSKGKYGNFEHFTRESDGETAYCIEPGVSLAKNTDYQGYYGLSNEELADKVNLSTQQLINMSLIAYYGYGYKNHNGTKWIVATQALIWKEAGRDFKFTSKYEPDPSNPNKYVIDTPSEIREAMEEIEELVDEHYNQPTFQTYNATISYGFDYTFHDQAGQLRKYDVKHCENCSATIDGDNLVVTPNSPEDGYVILSKENNYWSEEFIVYHSDMGQDVMVAGNLDPVQTRVNFKVISAILNLKKYDSENNQCVPQGQATLEGAIYGLYKEETGELVRRITIDSNCSATIDKLQLGNYYVQEIAPSNGYLLDTKRYSVHFTEENPIVDLDVKEQVVKNYISILKQYEYIDGNTAFLNAEADITFEIYYPDGRKFDQITTDKNGYATINLPYGTWKFHQVNTNTGFEKIYDFYITVDYESESEQYYNILNNSLNAYLQVIKVDSETGKTIAIANTTFKIYNKDTNQYVSQFVGGKIYDEFKTDENGKFMTYLKLESGNYKLIEVSSPFGYLLDENGVDFTIGDDTHFSYTTYGPVITMYVKNTPIKGQIEISKKGELFSVENGTFNYNDRISLEGIVYNIYAAEDIKSSDGNHLYYEKGALVGTMTTNKDGYAISDYLPLGKYKVVESKTNDFYILDKTEYYIELTEKDNRTEVVYSSHEMTNFLKKGTLEFTKTDLVTGEPIPNTIISVYTEKNQKIFEGITDENGKIIIKNLSVGQKYYILEKEAATGYLITDEKVFFEILEDGEVVKAEMKNTPITGTLEFTKTDMSTGEPLPNTLIEIYNNKDELIFSGRTDENGKIIISEIRFGRYYILEKEAPEGYILNQERMYFEILENGEIVKCTMVNELAPIPVPSTGIDDDSHLISSVVGSLLMIVGIGVVIYDKKKRK